MQVVHGQQQARRARTSSGRPDRRGQATLAAAGFSNSGAGPRVTDRANRTARCSTSRRRRQRGTSTDDRVMLVVGAVGGGGGTGTAAAAGTDAPAEQSRVTTGSPCASSSSTTTTASSTTSSSTSPSSGPTPRCGATTRSTSTSSTTFDGVLVSPGPGTPERAGRSIEVVRRGRRSGAAAARRVPRPPGDGVAWGGVVERAPELLHGKTSLVHHEGVGVLRRPARPVRRHPLPLADDPARHRCPPSWRSPAAPRAA